MFTPYVKGLLSPVELEKFEEVKKAITFIPEVPLPSGGLISCHMVCRVLAELTNLEYRDGYFGAGICHSWLPFKDCIIDPYPVGLLDTPIMFTTEYMLPWEKLYREAKLRIVKTKKFQRDLEYLRNATLALKEQNAK